LLDTPTFLSSIPARTRWLASRRTEEGQEKKGAREQGGSETD
jgi:hypothetical protein